MDSYQELLFENSLDGSKEPSLLWLPPEGDAGALVVGLHTWSADRFNQQEKMLPYCRERGWALLLPEFRGKNRMDNPRAREAGGSKVARRDIIDATETALADYLPAGVPRFLAGGSGGGHMSLLTAGAEDFQWTAISSWCPITDLAAWHSQNANYAPHVEAICGGAPGSSPKVGAEYCSRSPIQYAQKLARCRIQLGHGRYDAVVPYSHSWNLAVAVEQHQPEEFFFTLFDGTHQIHLDQAFQFFDATLGKRGGTTITG